MEFFNFLIRNKCNNLLNKEIGVCLSNHPQVLDFWKIAAYNEYENNLNAFVARNIFQKCIRMNKNNINAYLEYFIFEIKFIEKILERRKILTKSKEEEEKLKFVNDVNEKEDKMTENEKEVIAKIQEVLPAESDEVLNLKIGEIIWKKALNSSIEDNNINISLSFLRTLYMNKNKLGKNINYLKKLMIDSIQSDTKEMINFCLLKNKNKNSDKIEEEATLLVKIEIFLIKLEKCYDINNSGNEIDRMKV